MQPPPEYAGKTTTFRRYKKLSEDIIELEGGVNPPAGLINPDYKQQPNNLKKCVECGKTHDTIVENMITREKMEELDKCKNCFMAGIKWNGLM